VLVGHFQLFREFLSKKSGVDSEGVGAVRLAPSFTKQEETREEDRRLKSRMVKAFLMCKQVIS